MQPAEWHLDLTLGVESDGPAAVFAAALETAVRACMAPPGGGKLFFADLTKFPAVFSLSCPKRGMCQNFCCIAPAKVV
mgnify:FL=1